ncbi:MAG: T9SS type A sorting domain-containing protein [Bacteroidia bacterium]|nr:T9SS type A sorting domain-containing protein [Bacteroidia bacterium]
MVKYFFGLIASICLSSITTAQSFYVASIRDLPSPITKTFLMNLQNCDSLKIYTCPPTVDIFNSPEMTYTDIAADKNYLYYVTGGSGIFYKKNIGDTTSCQHLGTFNHSINALVADTMGTVYAAGQQNGICRLFKYNSNVFTQIGILPGNFFSSGDLFFYNNRLFMTGTSANFTSSYLVEVDINNPPQSCYYMGLQNLQPYAAFSVNNGNVSRAFIIGNSNVASVNTSSLIEIDMQAKTIGTVQCVYPFMVGGAAINYDYSTAGISLCNTTSLKNQFSDVNFFKVNNPITDFITFQTNVNLSDISSIELFDVSGKRIKNFTGSDISEKINITDIAPGIYILNMHAIAGDQYQQKLIK